MFLILGALLEGGHTHMCLLSLSLSHTHTLINALPVVDILVIRTYDVIEVNQNDDLVLIY